MVREHSHGSNAGQQNVKEDVTIRDDQSEGLDYFRRDVIQSTLDQDGLARFHRPRQATSCSMVISKKRGQGLMSAPACA